MLPYSGHDAIVVDALAAGAPRYCRSGNSKRRRYAAARVFSVRKMRAVPFVMPNAYVTQRAYDA